MYVCNARISIMGVLFSNRASYGKCDGHQSIPHAQQSVRRTLWATSERSILPNARRDESCPCSPFGPPQHRFGYLLKPDLRHSPGRDMVAMGRAQHCGEGKGHGRAFLAFRRPARDAQRHLVGKISDENGAREGGSDEAHRCFPAPLRKIHEERVSPPGSVA